MTSSHTSNDFDRHIAALRALPSHECSELRTLFQPDVPVHVARAPGRLDVMGGIADYSGSLVLQLPIAEAAFAFAQPSDDGTVSIASLDRGVAAAPRLYSLTKRKWATLQSADYDAARQFLARDPAAAWAAYVLGPVLALFREMSTTLEKGLRVLISSDVPEGKGVSSSAAVEVATMRAAAALANIDLPGEDLAHLCQLAENRVAGAPCGIMDQVTSALGRENALLALRCQPASIEGFVPIPSGITFWGLDSGIRHAVSGSDYTSVRIGAFMGYRIIAEAAGLRFNVRGNSPNLLAVDDLRWRGYLANITPAEFHSQFAGTVPEHILGGYFLDRYGGTTDPVTRIDPAQVYAVRRPTQHPIEENDRCQRCRNLLDTPLDESSLLEMGRLMGASHDSYTACGLASDGTDLLVKLVNDAGPSSGLYGAKITGGGSGGTVAVLGRADADSAVRRVAALYSGLTGQPTHIFHGSSPGAYGTPVAEVVI